MAGKVLNASLAHLVEHRIRNAEVLGSRPGRGSWQINRNVKRAPNVDGFCFWTAPALTNVSKYHARVAEWYTRNVEVVVGRKAREGSTPSPRTRSNRMKIRETAMTHRQHPTSHDKHQAQQKQIAKRIREREQRDATAAKERARRDKKPKGS